MPKLIVNLPNRPKGEEIEVDRYGVFKNGFAYDIDHLFDPTTGEEVDELVIGDKDAKPPVVANINVDPVPSDDVSSEANDVSTDTDLPPVKGQDTGGESTGAQEAEEEK